MCPATAHVSTKKITTMRTDTEACETSSVSTDARLKECCLFLSEYSSALLGSGSTCMRLEKNVMSMAKALGYRVTMTILPRHIHLTVSSEDANESITYIADVATLPIRFDIITRLSELSRDLVSGRVDLSGARREFKAIIGAKKIYDRRVVLLVGLANASFCRLFGGDAHAMAVVLLSTLAGYYLRRELTMRHTDMRLVFILCSFVSSVLAAGATLFGLGSTPEIALATSVLYLVPGVPFLNSFSDLIAGHYISSMCRLTNAMILTACLSIGFLGGLAVMNLSMFKLI